MPAPALDQEADFWPNDRDEQSVEFAVNDFLTAASTIERLMGNGEIVWRLSWIEGLREGCQIVRGVLPR